jgi:FtsZ-binding cell division protein ZapB
LVRLFHSLPKEKKEEVLRRLSKFQDGKCFLCEEYLGTAPPESLDSDYDTVTAAVFLPEKQLEDILGLLEKLETKIQKAAQTVGIEATILGEKENPKNFNAVARIRKEDQTLMDELERGAELLPTQTPFQLSLHI